MGKLSIFVNNTVWIKFVAIVCFLLLFFSTIIAKNSPALKYEASIYSSTPLFLWFVLIISVIIGITIIVHQIYYRQEQKNIWFIGMVLIFLSYSICLSLFIIRGYYLWNGSGDLSTHLGYINQITLEGSIPYELFYPITHIYIAQISQLLDVNAVFLVHSIPLFLGLLYILFMHLFAKSILSDSRQIMLATVASATFVPGWYLLFTPNLLSNLLFPLLFFILIKSFITNKVAWNIILLIMVFLYPIFHPISTMAFIIVLVSLWIPQKTLNLSNQELNIYKNSLSRFNVTLVVILFVWGTSWVSSFYVWKSTISNIYRLMTENGPSHLSTLTDQAMFAQVYGYNVYETAFKLMGGSIVYFILAVICLPIIWKKIKFSKQLHNLFSLYGPIFVLGLFILIFFFTNIGFGPLRFVFYIDIISTIFVGFLLCELIDKSRNINWQHGSKLVCVFVIIFLVSIFFIGLMKLYPSPYTYGISYHTTQTEVEGMNWFFDNRNLDIGISGISVAPGRFASLLLNFSDAKIQKFPLYLTEDMKAPYHFGYDNNSVLSTHYNEGIYLALTEKDKAIYRDIFPEMAEYRWSGDDFKKIESDQSVDKLYSNCGFDLWYISDSYK